ncbi:MULTISPECIES: hypothetical protein [Alteribacter]|uniref:Uncharacterized protein n=1 Tax=Alteribacter keqinensis TaxID=2483800 RepID=A0A3M7TVX8_9BACI|nr:MULTISPECIES: hypothetical protein [Alteribacter]MBM7094341.1 hypothetical protein [Alteribacter salitolerans]RNA69429.1 hypothetical protein EBO34_05685 [Alteribacter keqinensis]
MTLKKWLSSMFLFAAFFFTPVMMTYAAGGGGGNGEEESVSWVTQLPLTIMAFATIIVMIYYAFRD